MTPKKTLPGIDYMNDPLHGRQACPEFKLFHRGVGQISPPEGLFTCRSLPKRGQICYIPAPAQSLNDSKSRSKGAPSEFEMTHGENKTSGEIIPRSEIFQ